MVAGLPAQLSSAVNPCREVTLASLFPVVVGHLSGGISWRLGTFPDGAVRPAGVLFLRDLLRKDMDGVAERVE